MIVLEFFSASGGMAEGLRRAGIDISLAFDKSPDAVASYEKNLGHRPVEIDVRDVLRMLQRGWRPGACHNAAIDLVVADPPCTPWSRAGKRKGTDDARDMLTETVEIIRLLRPTYWLIANVPGLDDEPNWPTVQQTIGSLAKEGWCIDFARLDAASYGVPQHRVRPFWYGHPMSLTRCIQWPERTHGSPEEMRTLPLAGTRALLPWVTCRQALSHLPLAELGSPIRLRWRGMNGKQAASVPDKPARVVGTSSLSDGNVLTSPEASRSARKRAPSRRPRATPSGTVTTSGTGNGKVLFDGPTHRPSQPDAPARAVTGNTHGDGALLATGMPQLLDEYVAHGYEFKWSEANSIGFVNPPGVTSLLTNEKHPVNTPDAPSFCVTTKGDGRGAQGACVMVDAGTERWRRPSRSDEPARTVTAGTGTNGNKCMGWPWDRPATTVTADDRLAPPGHHSKGGSWLSDNRGHGPNAIKLSEKAAAILQGFPDGWTFVGKTKEARWSLLGQAMPPGLAEAVGRSMKKAMGGER